MPIEYYVGFTIGDKEYRVGPHPSDKTMIAADMLNNFAMVMATSMPRTVPQQIALIAKKDGKKFSIAYDVFRQVVSESKLTLSDEGWLEAMAKLLFQDLEKTEAA